jgi:hypothetical protein
MNGAYPYGPGVHANSTGTTAEEARDRVRHIAPTLENLCLDLVRQGPVTPDEAHRYIERELGRSVKLYSVRPRFSALRAKGLVQDSGERRAPPGECKAIVWRASTPEEIAAFDAQRATIRANLGAGQ